MGNKIFNYYKSIISIFKIKKIVLWSLTIIFVLLIFDHYNVTQIVYKYANLPIIVTGILAICVFINPEQIYALSRLNIVNYFDYWITVIFSAAFIFGILFIFSDGFLSCEEAAPFLGWGSFYAFIVLFRIYIIYKKTEKNSPINVLDLKKVYDGDLMDVKDEDIIFIDEKAVDYDMLGRTSIIKELYMAIKNCRTNGHYVIALTGSWGSGKTTIINNVESMLSKSNVDDLIIVKTFDPWIFEEKDAMFRAMFDAIFSKIGIKFSARDLDMYYGTLQKIIFGKIGVDIKYNGNDDDEIEKINKMINSYLEKNNKRVLFVIDNIERSNHEHLLLLFKSISSVFTFKRFIILLSYDKEVMEKVFVTKLDTKYDYIDKVIQHEIVVPKLDVNIVENINERCILNILRFYGLKESDIELISPIICEYSREIKDIRDLKRNINSILALSCLNNNYLNKVDSFIIKYISINNSLLYESIYNNKKYFISFNDNYLFGFDLILDNDVFNKELDAFFEELFSGENKKYLGLLSLIFPYVKSFKEKRNNQIPLYKRKHDYIDKKSVKQNEARRIYNAKFWDLYFTSDVNEFLLIDIYVNTFIEYINIGEHNFENIECELNKIINLYTNFIQKFTIQTLEYYTDEIRVNLLATTYAMYNCVLKLNDDSDVVSLSAKGRMEYLVSVMIRKLSNKDFETFVLNIKNDYGKLGVIRSIDYWLGSEKLETFNEKTYQNFHQIYENMKSEIIEKDINIYSKQLYAIHNVFAFFGSEENLKYISSLIDENSIYMFLADMISESRYSGGDDGGGFGYKMVLSHIEKVITLDEVNMILMKSPPKSHQEEFILSVYNYSIKELNNDDFLSNGVKSRVKIDFEIKNDFYST